MYHGGQSSSSSSMVGRDRERDSGVQVCVCMRVWVGAALLCGGRCIKE